MKTEFSVFDPISGNKTRFNTLDEALTYRKSLIDSWVNSKIIEAKGLHAVTTISIDDSGNELWSSVSYETLNNI